MICVKTYYNTDADGRPVPEDVPMEDMPITYHGPFDSMTEAVSWMETVWPDDDTDIYEQIADDFDLPDDTYVNDPASLYDGKQD